MRHSASDHEVREFPPIMAFIAAFTLTLIVGGVGFTYAIGGGPHGSELAPAKAPHVPSMDEYRTALLKAAGGFLTDASAMDTAGVLSADPSLLGRAQKARDRVIAVVAPAKEDVHLSLVLLLDKWIRALQGDPVESVNVVPATADFLERYPWFVAPGA